MIEKLTKCLKLQNKFNASVNPDWQIAGYAWKRAMWVEAAELTDHLNYKWWKNVNKVGDREQALLEAVDIFHFLLSDVMIQWQENYKSDPLFVQKQLANAYDFALKHGKKSEKEVTFQKIEDFVSDCVEGRNAVKTYFNMIVALGFTLEDVVDYYLGKNALNLFRLDHGYREGTYQKAWNGKEDNVILDEILKTGERNFDSIYLELNRRYIEALSV